MIDVPIVSVPVSVDVITEALRQDQQAIDMDDVLRDISSAIKVGNENRPGTFLLRGFVVNPEDYRKDGCRRP